MVLRQVREDERGEADAVEPAERRAVRRRLHARAAVAGVEHLPELALQVDRLGRRAHGRPPLAADAALDRPEQPGPPAGRGEDRVEQERRRRLAVRAGDAGDLRAPRSGGRRTRRPRRPSLRARSATTSCGTSSSSGRSTTSATAPFATASAANSCPSARVPGTQKKRLPGRARAGVVGEVGDLDGSPPERRPTARAPRSAGRAPSRRESTARPSRDGSALRPENRVFAALL